MRNVLLTLDPSGGEPPDENIDKGPIKEIRKRARALEKNEKVAVKHPKNPT
jgi:hypothetical protein